MVITVYYADTSMDVFFNAIMSYDLEGLLTINYSTMAHYPNFMAIKKTEDEIYQDRGRMDPIFRQMFTNKSTTGTDSNAVAQMYRTIMYVPVDRVLKIKAAPEATDEVSALWSHNIRTSVYSDINKRKND